jgi:hypothetical protein
MQVSVAICLIGPNILFNTHSFETSQFLFIPSQRETKYGTCSAPKKERNSIFEQGCFIFKGLRNKVNNFE